MSAEVGALCYRPASAGSVGTSGDSERRALVASYTREMMRGVCEAFGARAELIKTGTPPGTSLAFQQEPRAFMHPGRCDAGPFAAVGSGVLDDQRPATGRTVTARTAALSYIGGE